MKRLIAAVAATLALAACGHPGVPSSALRAAPTFTAQPEAAQSPMLAVDLYAPANYPAAVVRADGTRTLAYIKNVLHANTVGIVWDYFSASDTSSTVQRTRKTLTPRNVAILTRIARADGLRVEYRPLIFVPSAPNPWEGLILPANPLQWFASYYQAELPYLKVAQRLHVREFVLATEMHVLNGSHLWPLLFSRAASVYHGTVSYAAWEGDYFPAGAHVLPIQHLGMDMYAQLHVPADATVAQVTAAWAQKFSGIPAAVLRRTAIDETGIQARRGALRTVYATPLANGSSFFVTDLETSELAKVAANAFLATKISFINAMAEVCEAGNANVRDLARIIGADPRIGPEFLSAGLGFGGGCLPKDIRAFSARAEELGVGNALGFLHEVDSINLRCRARTADLALEMAENNLTDIAVAVLGAAFKPGSDDVRDSPALDVAQILHGMGARVTVYDPAALANAQRDCPQLRYAGSVTEAARDAHMLLLLTEWPEFSALRPEALGAVVKHRRLIDARNILDPGPWYAAGWDYRALGLATGQVGTRSLYREVTNLGEQECLVNA